MPASRRFGLSAAASSPFHDDGRINHALLVEHVKWCLADGCSSVTVFGTTGEGASIALAEREQVFGALAAHNIGGDKIVGGIAAATLQDATAQARAALDFGCRALLLAPPFYFKNVSDDGLFRWFAQLFEALGASARDILLYHIPSMTQAGLSVALVGRLRKAFPEIIAGVKDSSGDWFNTEALLRQHSDLAILVGDERQLARAVRAGAQGTICGLANICPGAMLPLAERGQDDPRIKQLVDALEEFPVIAAVKAIIAHRTGDKSWLNTRAPLSPIGAAELVALAGHYDAIFASKAA
jgi:4-hydroxy-tetrahydrodipicolinate synthase